MKLKDLKIPLIILSTGIVMFGGSLLIANWYRWTPISFAIDLRPGVSQSPPFRVNLTTDYLIELETERNLPFEQLNCLLGVDPGFPEHCRTIPSPVDLKWTVFSSGRQVAQGTSQQESSGAWGTKIRRTIGRFRGEKGSEYSVQIESLKDASVLAPTNPRITIGVHPIESKGHYVIAQLVGWIALVVIGVGMLWLLIRIFAKNPSRRSFQNDPN